MKDAQKPDHVSLNTLIARLKEGRFVIPDFQREFEWRPWDIRELLRSIFLDYYIGSLLLWKGTKENFAALSCEAVYGFTGEGKPEYIVLDGQQRLTAMHYAFLSPDAPLPNRTNRFYYFLRVDRFMREEYDDAFDYDALTRSRLETLRKPEIQYAEHIFPMGTIGSGGWDLPNWVQGYEKFWLSKADTASSVPVPLDAGVKPREFPIPESGGLVLAVMVRPVGTQALREGRLPVGTHSVSVFLVNRRPPHREHGWRAFVFQTRLRLESTRPFVARPDLRCSSDGEAWDRWDDDVADLHYRDVCEYAVGHGVSACSERGETNHCTAVRTTWIPTAEVERVAPASIPDVELRMEALGALSNGEDVKLKLGPLITYYRAWIVAQGDSFAGLSENRTRTGKELLKAAQYAATRIEAGISLLADPAQTMALDAFRIANRAMAKAARQREGVQKQVDPAELEPPRWRPFQLAFILMTLRGILDPRHAERECVDLLFFPTGGGKTEAYLGLSAFTMVLRRLRNPSIRSAGVSVLMRYTLRLLTLDQLGRAAALMCALELEREKEQDGSGAKRLGEWPFEIGLWVGQAATPNRMGHRGDTSKYREYTAYTKTMRFKRDDRGNPSPIPIEDCPWCGTKFKKDSFRLVPSEANPRDLRVHCVNYRCLFSGDRSLPIVAVDEPIYRRLPAFLIATVDKFAALPWTGECGTLFGLVNRYNRDGFYGACSRETAQAFEGPLPPPDLIIQDELHLISGPLGTIAGVYEVAIDALSSRTNRPGAKTSRIQRRGCVSVQSCGSPEESEFAPVPPPVGAASSWRRDVLAVQHARSGPRWTGTPAACGR